MMEQTNNNNRHGNCVCVVCKILEKGFSTFGFREKRDVVSSGRPMPMLNLETNVKQSTKKNKFIRHFKVDFYEKYKWLTGCTILSKLFCWPCLLFNLSEKTPWNSSGFSDLNNLHKNVKRHTNSKGHLTALIKEKTFGKTRIEHSLDNQLKINHRQHNELVAKNRNILKRLIDVTCFLGTHELSFRGHQEDSDSTNRGNYIDLINFLANYDETLKMHLKDSTVFRGTSNRIQNDLMKCIADVLLDSIKREIRDAAFVSIVLDETTDVTNFSQLAVVVRYVKSDGAIQERFLRFLDVTSDRTAEAMFKIVLDIIEELECGTKLVAQSYDGAAVMAGQLGGLQAKVKERFQNAMFVHCFAHRLNLVLSQSVGLIKDCKVFFSTLGGMAAYFSKSSKRTRALDIHVQKRFPKVAPTRWNYSGRLVQTVWQYHDALIELFKHILDNKPLWDPETINSSRGYLQLLESDFNFNFLLNVFSKIFPHTDVLFDILQSKSNDIGFCVQNINALENRLSEKRDRFQQIWDETVNLITEPQRKRMRVDNVGDRETSYRRLYLEIFDNITQQLRARFQNFSELKFLELCNFSNYSNSRFPEDAFGSLKLSYANLFDTEALHSQLNVLYDSPEVNNQKTPLSMLLFLKETGLDESYSEVLKLCQLVLTIPATSASVERSFSTLKRIKTFVRNSTGEERLSNLAVLSIEKECIKDLKVQNPRFYEDVIDRFAQVDRRIELHFK